MDDFKSSGSKDLVVVTF